jgi:transposase InsO family protein
MSSSDVASRPLEKIFIDFVGKLPRSKYENTYALVCVDAFTKFVCIFPVREASTATTIKALNSIFATFGVPEILVSDNATQFTSRNFRRF